MPAFQMHEDGVPIDCRKALLGYALVAMGLDQENRPSGQVLELAELALRSTIFNQWQQFDVYNASPDHSSAFNLALHRPVLFYRKSRLADSRGGNLHLKATLWHFPASEGLQLFPS